MDKTSDEMSVEKSNFVIDKTAQIISAYVVKNHVPQAELLKTITAVGEKLNDLCHGAKPADRQTKKTPAVTIKRSVTKTALICLDCGKQFKTLKRHLSANHGMTIEQYKSKWGLDESYPVTAEAYTQHRSEIAQSLGLGRKRGTKKKTRKKATRG